MSNEVLEIPLHFARVNKPAKIPAWAKDLRAITTTVEKLFGAASTEGVAVIQSPNRKDLELALEKVSRDPERFARNFAALHVVVQFAAAEKPAVAEVTRVLRFFHSSPGKVDFAWGQDQLQQSVIEAIAKFQVEQENRRAEEPDPLAHVKEVIDATRFLLAPSGRLSATAVADFFGISTAKLGEIIGRSRQALGKTPDSAAIQSGLRPFERIARLRSVFSKELFQAWLHRPNRQLGDVPPLQLIEDGRVGIVADLAEDMLLGTPG